MRSTLIIISLIFSFDSISQNLFSNGDFENYSSCPSSMGQINNAIGITSCTVTPDYYNSSCNFLPSDASGSTWCSMNAEATIPSGNAFIGFFGGLFNSTSYQYESFILTLDSPTTAGQVYNIDFDMMTVDRPNGPCYAPAIGDCIDFGFYFYDSNNPINCPTGWQYSISSPPHPSPHASTGVGNISVGSWSNHTLSFTANGVYDRVLIYFFPNSNTGNSGCTSGTGKFFMDNLCIHPQGGTCETCSYTIEAGNNQSICEGNTATLNGSSAGGVSSVHWTSSGDGTFSSPNTNSTNYTPGSNDITNGTVTLTITSDDPGAPCNVVSDSLIVTIMSNSTPTITDINDLCSTNSNVILSVNVPGGTWSGNGIVNTNTGEFSPQIAGAGNWNVQYIIPGTCGSSDDIEIIVHQGYSIDAGENETLCEGDEYQYQAISTGSPSVNWSTNGDGILSNSNGLTGVYIPGILDISNGQVVLKINTDTPNSPCTQKEDSVIITIQPLADASFLLPDSICESETSIQLTANNNGGIWSGSGIVDANQGVFSPSIAGYGDWVISYEINGSCGNQSSQIIHVIESKDPNFDYVDEFYCLPTENPLPIIYGENGGVFSINNNGVIDPNNGMIDISSSGVGIFEISYTFLNGCKESYFDIIEICNQYEISIPNVFTPNGDHSNDLMTLKIKGVKSIRGEILNRWGNVIVKIDLNNLESINEVSIWDGKSYNGQDATNGVYFYNISIIDISNTEYNYQGIVNLIE